MDNRNPGSNRRRRVCRFGAALLATLLGGACLARGGAQAQGDVAMRSTGEGCRRGGEAPAVVAACSEIIATSRDSRASERAYRGLGLPEEAAADFTAALATRPSDPAASRERGLVRHRLGDDAGARPDLRTALASGLQDDVAAEALRRIEAATSPATAVAPRPDQGQAEAQLSPNQRFEMDSKRRVQEDQDAAAARVLADAKLKAARLARTSDDARRALKDAADFVASNRDDPKLEDHLRRIGRLRSAVDASDAEVIASEAQDLRAGLADDSVYAAYKSRAEANHWADEQQILNDALRTLRVQRVFLVDAAARDALSPAVGDFMTLADQIQGVQANPDLGRAETLMGRIDAAISKAGLGQSYAAFQKTGSSDVGPRAAEHDTPDGAQEPTPRR